MDTDTLIYSNSISTLDNNIINEPINETIQETINEPINETIQETINEPINETIQETINEPINETIQETINEPIDEAFNEQLDGDVDPNEPKSVSNYDDNDISADTLEQNESEDSNPDIVQLKDINKFKEFVKSLQIMQPVEFITSPMNDNISNHTYYFVTILRGEKVFFTNRDISDIQFRNIYINIDNPVENEHNIKSIFIKKIDPTSLGETTVEEAEGIVETDIIYEVEEKIEELSSWQKEYTSEEIRQSLIEELSDYYSDKKSAYDVFFEAQSILDFVKKYQAHEKENYINDIRRTPNTFKPQLKAVLDYNFHNVDIYPIVIDSKKYYTENDSLINAEKNDEMETEPTLHYMSFQQELETLVELYKLYARSSKRQTGVVHLSYQEFINILYKGGSIQVENEDGDEEDITFEPIHRAYVVKDKNINKTYYRLTLHKKTLVFRNCFTGNECILNPENNSKGVQVNRIADGPELTLEDKLDQTLISEVKGRHGRIKTCNGTNKSGDVFYGGGDKSDDFNKTISKPPKPVELTSGEEVVVVGLYIKALGKKSVNVLQGTEIVSQEGNHKIYPKIFNDGFRLVDIKNASFSKKVEVINDPSQLNWKTIKLDHDYMIFFDSVKQNKLAKEDFYGMVENILPSIEDILHIHKDHLKNADNFKTIQAILNNYQLEFRDINSDLMERFKIKNILIENISRIQTMNRVIEKKYLESKDKLNTFNYIFNSLIEMKWICEEKVMQNRYSMPNLESIQGIRNLFIERGNFFLSNYSSDELEEFLFEYLQIESSNELGRDIIIHTILDYFIDIMDYKFNTSEFYSYFFKAHSLIDPKYQNLFQMFIELYRIETTDYTRASYMQFDQNLLKQIDFMRQITKLPNAGSDFFKLINLSNREKYKFLVDNVIENYAKRDYESQTGLSWSDLPMELRLKYYPNKNELKYLNDTKKQAMEIYEIERRKMNFYVNKCSNIKISKIYNGKNMMDNDNGKDVYYDEQFDTTKNDLKMYTTYISNNINSGKTQEVIKKDVLELLSSTYIYATEQELIDQYNNILEIKDSIVKRRRVKQGDIAIVLHEDKKYLYRRIQNVWIPVDKSALQTISKCYKYDIDFLNVPFEKLAEYCKNAENNGDGSEGDCVATDKHNVPRKLYSILYYHEYLEKKLNNLTKLLQFQDTIDGDIKNTFTELQNNYNLLKKLDEKKERSLYKKPVIEKTQFVYPPQSLMNELNAIRKIEDFDLLSSTLLSFIEKHGVEHNRNLPGANDKYYYFDIPRVNVPIICKHFKNLFLAAYKDNTFKSNMLEKVKQEWGVKTNAHYICKNCGEIIDYVRYSEFEGFGKNDKAINVREKVIENVQEDEIDISFIEFNEQEQTIYDKLTGITKVVNLKLKANDSLFIIKKVADFIQYTPTLHEFYFNVLKNTSSPELKKIIFNDEYLVQEKTFLDEYGTFSMTTVVKMKSNIKKYSKLIPYFFSINAGKIEDGKPGRFIVMHVGYKSLMLLRYLTSCLIHVIRNGIPDYNIKGTGQERKTGGIIIKDFYTNEKFAIKYVSDLVFNQISKVNDDKLYSTARVYLNILYKGSESDTFTSIINDTYQELALLSDIREKSAAKDNYRLEKMVENDKISINYGWNNFLPQMEVSNRFSYEIPDLDALIASYNYDHSQLMQLNNQLNDMSPTEITQQLKDRQIALTHSINSSRDILTLIANKLSYYYIDSLNTIISEEAQSNYKLSAYTYHVSFGPLKDNYNTYFINKNPEISNIVENLNKIYRFLSNNASENKSRVLEYVKQNSKYRDLQSFMYFDSTLFKEDAELMHKALVEKIKQVNYITNIREGPLKGTKRFFKEIDDYDYNIVIDVYSENPEMTDDVLVNIVKGKLMEKYGDSILQSIDLKLKILLEYNGKVEVDILSGEIKADISKSIDEITRGMSIENLKNMLTQYAVYSDLKNIVYKNELSMLEDIEINSKRSLVAARTKKVLDNFSEIFQVNYNLQSEGDDGNEIEKLVKELQSIQQTITEYVENNKYIDFNALNNFQNKINGAIGKIYDDYLLDKVTKISKNMSRINTKIDKETVKKFLLDDIFSVHKYYNEIVQNLSSTLKIEGFFDTKSIEVEKRFRINLLNQQRDSYGIIVGRQLVGYILTLLSRIENKFSGNERGSFHYKKADNAVLNEILKKYNDVMNLSIRSLIELDGSIDLEIPFEKINHFLQELVCYEAEINSNGETQSIFVNSPKFFNILLKILVVFLLSHLISDDTFEPEQRNVLDTFFNHIYSFMVSVNTFNNMTDTNVFEIIKKQRADENLNKIKRFQKLPEELKNTQKLYRRFNLGNIFSGFEDIQEMVNEEALFQSDDILNAEREQSLAQNIFENMGLDGQALVDQMDGLQERMQVEQQIIEDDLTMELGEEDEDNFYEED